VHMQYDTSFLKVTWNIIVLEHHVASVHFNVYEINLKIIKKYNLA